MMDIVGLMHCSRAPQTKDIRHHGKTSILTEDAKTADPQQGKDLQHLTDQVIRILSNVQGPIAELVIENQIHGQAKQAPLALLPKRKDRMAHSSVRCRNTKPKRGWHSD
jgi:hypothetical protein